MTKQKFLDNVRGHIGALPKQDRDRFLEFYSESIDDRIEDGLTEEAAVEAIGSVEEVVAQILSEAQPAPEETTPVRRKLRVWELVLLVLGSPLWITLLAAFAVVVLSIVLVLVTGYVVLWAGVAALYAGDLSMAAGAVAGFLGGAYYLTSGNIGPALMAFGTGIALIGAAILAFFICNLAAKGVLALGKLILRGIRALIARKGAK